MLTRPGIAGRNLQRKLLHFVLNLRDCTTFCWDLPLGWEVLVSCLVLVNYLVLVEERVVLKSLKVYSFVREKVVARIFRRLLKRVCKINFCSRVLSA